jgi:hypothetical protein
MNSEVNIDTIMRRVGRKVKETGKKGKEIPLLPSEIGYIISLKKQQPTGYASGKLTRIRKAMYRYWYDENGHYNSIYANYASVEHEENDILYYFYINSDNQWFYLKQIKF